MTMSGANIAGNAVMSIQRRTTWKFRAGWSDMDQWDEVGQATMSFCQTQTDEDSGYEARTTVMIMEVTPHEGVTRHEVKEALRDTFSGTNCQHEYDCCGCWSRFARVHHASGNEWIIVVSASRNY